MATLQNLLDNLNKTRETTTKGPSFVEGLDKLIAALNGANSRLSELGNNVKDMVVANKAAEKIGKASDVQKTIKAMLSAQIEANKIEQDRHARFMDMAEKLVPQVTDEQVQAIKEQRAAYKEHQQVLQDTLDIECKKATIQKKAFDDIATKNISRLDREKAGAEFALKDKYGTIGTAISGLGSKAQDPLSKFLVSGLGRYVSDVKEAPKAKSIQDKYTSDVQRWKDIAETKKTDVDKKLEDKLSDIKEDFDVKALKAHIVDPGSITSLFKYRDEQIAKLAQTAVQTESLISKGNKASNGTRPIKAHTSGTSPEGPTNKATQDITKVSASPSNVTFKKVPNQATAIVTPRKHNGGVSSVMRDKLSSAPIVKPSASAFGSKSGFINLAGIGKSLSALASNFTKFLGPWGLVANAVMSFDKLVPIISDGAGALMDFTKLLVPMLVSTITEAGNGFIMGLNALTETIDRSVIGEGFTEENDKAITSKISEYQDTRDNKILEDRLIAKRARENALTLESLPDTTTQIGGVKVSRKDAPKLTDPIEKSYLDKASSGNASTSSANLEMLVQSMQGLPNTLASIQKSVLDSSLQPNGTTPIMLMPPSLTGWVI